MFDFSPVLSSFRFRVDDVFPLFRFSPGTAFTVFFQSSHFLPLLKGRWAVSECCPPLSSSFSLVLSFVDEASKFSRFQSF